VIGEAAIAAAALLAAGLYLLMSRNLLRIGIGFLLLSNGMNLFVITAAGLPARAQPPVLRPEGAGLQPTPLVDPLPHALVLTAIVIGLAAAAFLLALAVRARAETGSDEPPTGGDG
jgi:multicomponent Na+:H+ antiporter subunit C